MPELDHIFVLCPVDAEAAAQALNRAGLAEGSRNSHDGQGTTCRRFFFKNAYIELLWVSDPREAQSELTQRTRLWERWSKRRDGACPFGIVLRAGTTASATDCPFPAWAYRPHYLPPTLSIDIAAETSLEEPELLYLGFQRARARQGLEPISHRIPVNRLTRVNVGLPPSVNRSSAAQTLERTEMLSFTTGDDYLLSLTFNDGPKFDKTADLRPDIPLTLHW